MYQSRGLAALHTSAGSSFADAPPEEGTPPAPHVVEEEDPEGNEDWVGRKNRRAVDLPGSIVQLAVSEARGHAGAARGDAAAKAALDRTVFFDNLPPDATPDELAGLLVRAGAVDHVELFGGAEPDDDADDAANNARPRRRAGAKKKGERAPYRLRLSVANRSPTCALVTFSTPEGAEAALDSALRVFGVVVRRRACRTRPATDVKSLYIHKLPPNVTEDKLLAELHAVLAPTLALRVWRTDPVDPPDRARLRFKTHDLARFAWEVLADGSPFAANLSWTATPPLKETAQRRR